MITSHFYSALHTISYNMQMRVYQSYLLVTLYLVQNLSLAVCYENSILASVVPDKAIMISNIILPFKLLDEPNMEFVIFSLSVITGLYIYYCCCFCLISLYKSPKMISNFYGKTLRFFEFGLFLPTTGSLLFIIIRYSSGNAYVNVLIKLIAVVYIIVAVMLKFLLKLISTNYKFTFKDTLSSNFNINLLLGESGSLLLLLLYNLLSKELRVEMLPIGYQLFSLFIIANLVLQTSYKSYPVLLYLIFIYFVMF